VAEAAAPEPAAAAPVNVFARLINGLRQFLARLFGDGESRVASAPSAQAVG